MLDRIQAAFREGRVDVGPHAQLRMNQWRLGFGDMIELVGHGAVEIVENYPDDRRGASCLLLTTTGGRVIHLVCTTTVTPFVITCYVPDPDEWSPDYRTGRK